MLKREIGDQEESKALEYFEAKGWKLLQKNYLTRMGEVDLILKDPKGVIVFVEVRYRKYSDFGTAAATVNFKKQQRIVKSALQYIKVHRLYHSDFRFDVAAISPEGLEHIPNAFSASGYTL